MSEEICISEEAFRTANAIFNRVDSVTYYDRLNKDSEREERDWMANQIQLLLNQQIQLACMNWRHRDAALQTKIAALEKLNTILRNQIKDEQSKALENMKNNHNRIDALEEEVVGLKIILKQSETMLRSFRYSMDSNLPFPSMIKLDEAIAAIQLKQT